MKQNPNKLDPNNLPEKAPFNKQCKDISNQKFGLLTALYRTNIKAKNGSYCWVCKCDCGNYVLERLDHLTTKNTISCGCYNEQYNLYKPHDLTNKVFGELTALYDTGIIDNKQGHLWHCKCSCGNEIDVYASRLISLEITHCGHKKKFSKGEEAIAKILNEHNIPFEKEKTFPTLVGERKMRFDFWVNNAYAIEYDGIQHFTTKNSGWDTQKQLEVTQKRDQIKNQWCKNNNIPLIRIPYTIFESNQLTFSDLDLNTSTYILK